MGHCGELVAPGPRALVRLDGPVRLERERLDWTWLGAPAAGGATPPPWERNLSTSTAWRAWRRHRWRPSPARPSPTLRRGRCLRSPLGSADWRRERYSRATRQLTVSTRARTVR